MQRGRREREREGASGLAFEVLDVCAPQTDREPSKSGKKHKIGFIEALTIFQGRFAIYTLVREMLSVLTKLPTLICFYCQTYNLVQLD